MVEDTDLNQQDKYPIDFGFRRTVSEALTLYLPISAA